MTAAYDPALAAALRARLLPDAGASPYKIFLTGAEAGTLLAALDAVAAIVAWVKAADEEVGTAYQQTEDELRRIAREAGGGQ